MNKSNWTYQKEIDSCHPEECTDPSQEPLVFNADRLAMQLVGERYNKRDLVDLVRWLILRNPKGLI